MGGPIDYSTTAGSNTTVGGVSIAEGMQAGLMNNALRAAMADTRKWQLDWSGVVTAGSGNAYTITSNQGISAYADGLRFSFRADRNNTGAATLNVDGRGAKALRKAAGGALTALVADDLVAEAVYDAVYDLSSDVFIIVGSPALAATAFGQSLIEATDAAAAQAVLNLEPGTDVQAYSANLASLAGLTLAEGDLLYATGADTLVKLAKGTAGQVLRMNSGATAPEWVGGNIGVGQTWQDVTGSRVRGTSYQNTTGRPIMVSVSTDGGTTDSSFEVSVDNSTWVTVGEAASTVGAYQIIVPSGWYYRAKGSDSLLSWAELR